MKYGFKDYLKDRYKVDSLPKVFLQILKSIGGAIGLFLFVLILYFGILLIATAVGVALNMIPVVASVGLNGMSIGLLFLALIVAVLSLYSKIKEIIFEYKISKLDKEAEMLSLEVARREKEIVERIMNKKEDDTLF